jgi:hypothetical protein
VPINMIVAKKEMNSLLMKYLFYFSREDGPSACLQLFSAALWK